MGGTSIIAEISRTTFSGYLVIRLSNSFEIILIVLYVSRSRMSSLYPSLEDMQCHKIIQAQESAFAQYQRPATQAMPSAPPSYPAPSQLGYPDLTIPKEASYPSAPTSASVGNATVTELYPGLADFMGLELSEEMIAANMPEYLRSNQVAMPSSNYMMPSPNVSGGLIAPLSGQSVGLQRAQVTHGIRELTLCKDADKKVGLRVKDINNGVFVTVVVKGSPAALAGYVENDYTRYTYIVEIQLFPMLFPYVASVLATKSYKSMEQQWPA